MAGNANYDPSLVAMTFALFLEKQPKDAIFNELTLFNFLNSKNRIKRKGGVKLLEPLMYAKSTSGDSYSGYDTFDVSPQEGFTNAEFAWKFYQWTLSISGPEQLQNAGESQMIDLLESKWEQTRMSIKDRLNTDAFSDGTGNGSKNILGLALIIDSTGTLGNIVRSSNSWWGAQETAVGGVLVIAGSTGMRRMMNDCAFGQSMQTPDGIVTTQAIFEAYEALMDPYMRFTVSDKDAVIQNPNLTFRGKPLMWDEACTAQAMYFLNSNFMKLVVHEERDFTPSEWKIPANQDARVAQIYWAGQMVASNCRRLGKLTGITNS